MAWWLVKHRDNFTLHLTLSCSLLHPLSYRNKATRTTLLPYNVIHNVSFCVFLKVGRWSIMNWILMWFFRDCTLKCVTYLCLVLIAIYLCVEWPISGYLIMILSWIKVTDMKLHLVYVRMVFHCLLTVECNLSSDITSPPPHHHRNRFCCS
jgi:hypothetical protein